MSTPDDEFFESLLATFREDAEDLLTEIAGGLLKLEEGGSVLCPEIVENVFRQTHSLKGAARAVRFREIETVCLNLENVFSLMKKGAFEPDAPAYDLFHTAIAVIRDILSEHPAGEISPGEIALRLRELYISDSGAPSGLIDPGVPVPSMNGREQASPAGRVSPDTTGGRYEPDLDVAYPAGDVSDRNQKDRNTVRISAHKLDRLITESEDLLSTRLFISQRMQELEEILNRFSLWRWNHSLVFNDLHLIREVLSGTEKSALPPEILMLLERIVDFLKYDREFVTNLQHDLATHIRATEVDRLALESSSMEISGLIHDAVLVPVSGMISSFSTHVKENARSLGKLAELTVEGGDLEMDRRILEVIRVPLIHLLHNSIDHGIEYPDLRKDRNKPPRGTISIKITPHSGSKVAIEIMDDGGGIDYSRVRATVIEKGLISPGEQEHITDEEIIWMIFKSGLSTSPVITDLSGRGLGLAIVEDTVTRLGGEIRVSSKKGVGTRFSLILPLRMATLKGLLVQSAGSLYVFPVQQIRQVIRVMPELIEQTEDGWWITYDNDRIEAIRLTSALGIRDDRPLGDTGEPVPVIILAYGAGQIACIIDEIIRVQEIVVRSLGIQLKRVKKITGAVILSDGKVALVLDPIELIQGALYGYLPEMTLPENTAGKKRILVADDSVTSRTLIKRTLEQAGYTVESAADGVEALAILRAVSVHLVVSDVDMPRMSGFTLTTRIREDDHLRSLPVVLVTALDSPEDREHGRNVGANAYIIKSSYEKSSLLRVVRNLLS